MKTLKEQQQILNDTFKTYFALPAVVGEQPKEAEGTYFVPHWTDLGETYSEAVNKVLEAIDKSRKFYNWRNGEINEKTLRRLPRPDNEIVYAQLGKKWKGNSVETVRKSYADGEYGLGAYEVGIILLTHPEILKSSDDLWIDCAGDEYGDGGFSSAPCFRFSDGEVKFGTYYVADANDYYGSASAVSSQSKLDPRPLESFESLSKRLERVETDMQKIRKFLILD